MKVLVLSSFGEIVDVCYRMVKEGVEVDLFIKDRECKKIGEGLVNRIESVGKWEGYDLIIFDDSIWGDAPQVLRKRGYKVIGGSKITDNLEQDRIKSYMTCNLLGIKTPKTYEFHSTQEAIKFIKRFPKEYVLKSYDEDKSITFLSKTKNSVDLIEFLNLNNNIKKVILQEKIRGYEVALSCFFNGEEFIPPLIVNYEHKKFGNNNTGVYTGEMGTVLYFYPFLRTNFFNETLVKLSPLLKNNYVGIIDANCIVNTTGCYVLEITPRFGYPITDIMSSNIKSWFDLFYGLVNKEYDAVCRNLILQDGVSIGVVILAISPLEKDNHLIGMPLVGLNKDLESNFSMYGVEKRNDKYFINDKYVGVVSATDKSLKLAKQKVYSLCQQICIPDLFYYRTDIGENIEIRHKWLQGIKLFKGVDK